MIQSFGAKRAEALFRDALPVQESKEFQPQMYADARRWTERIGRAGGPLRPASLGGIAEAAQCICVHLRTSAVELFFCLAPCQQGSQQER